MSILEEDFRSEELLDRVRDALVLHRDAFPGRDGLLHLGIRHALPGFVAIRKDFKRHHAKAPYIRFDGKNKCGNRLGSQPFDRQLDGSLDFVRFDVFARQAKVTDLDAFPDIVVEAIPRRQVTVDNSEMGEN